MRAVFGSKKWPVLNPLISTLSGRFLVTADTSLRVSFIRKLKERLPWVNRWVLGFYVVLFHICHLACACPEIFGRTLDARAARKYQETGDGQNRHCMKVAFLSFEHGYFSFYYVFRSSVNNGASKADRLGQSPHVSGHDANNRNGLAFPCFRCIAPIGEAKLYVFNADGADAAGVSMCDMCDGYSQTTYNCGEAVYNLASSVNEFRPAVQRIFDIDPWDSLNVLLLAELKIEPPYRGRGIGLTVISKMIKRWGKSCSLAVIKPFPLQSAGKDDGDTPEFKNAYRKLVRYYAPLGFTKIPYRNGSLEHGGGHYGLRLG
jgi:GNAT superfamily N-acetyltransferase